MDSYLQRRINQSESEKLLLIRNLFENSGGLSQYSQLSRELKKEKVSVSGAVRLRELFP